MLEEYRADDEGAESSPSEGLVDFAQFDAMIDSPDSPCVKIYSDFVKSAQQFLVNVRNALSEGNDEEVRSITHQLKGASASFGLTGFSARMLACEEAARNEACFSGQVSAMSWYEESVRLLITSAEVIAAQRQITV